MSDAPSLIPAASMSDAYMGQRSRAAADENDPLKWLERTTPKPVPEGQAPPADTADPMDFILPRGNRASAALEGLLRAGADIGKGVFVEAPGAIYRGATGAVENVFKTADSLAGWLNENVADLTVPVPDWVPEWVNNPARGISDTAGAAKSIVDDRTTVTGKMTEFVSQWLTSIAIVGPVAKTLGMAPGVVTNTLKAGAAGAIGFDPKEPRLSNVIQEAAPNPITEFLQADEEDSELLGRIKSGLENAGLGLAADGVVQGFRVLRAQNVASREAAAAKTAPTPETPSPAAADGVPAPDAPPAPIAKPSPIAFTEETADKAAAFLRGEQGAAPVQVNLSRFEGPDQIVDGIRRMSTMLPEGTSIPMAQTQAAARDLGMTADELAAGIQGGAFDSKQIAAGWMLYRSAAGEVMRLAERARATGSVEDISRFNAGFQTAFGILQTVKGQSAEIARALQIHSAMRRSDPDMVKGLQAMIEEGGGTMKSLELAERIALLNDPALAAAAITQASKATTRDQLVYIFANLKLSNPATHVANVLDTTAATFWQVPETWFASVLSKDIAKGEATARLFGQVRGMRDGIRAAGKTWRTGDSEFAMGTRVEGYSGPLARTEDLVQGGSTRQAADYLAMLIPTRLLQAGDELTKFINYRGEAAALAHRRAVITEGLSGPDAARRVDELLSDMPDWLSKQAEAQALKGTFNEPLTGVGKLAGDLVDRVNIPVGGGLEIPVGRIIAPFIRTPINLTRWWFHRTPAAFLSPKIQAEIAAGGATRATALARVAVGSTITASIADFTLQGRVTGTGPKDPELRAALMRTGWQPYSFRTSEGNYVSYDRSGTLGALIGLAADATELMSGVYGKQSERIDLDGIPVEDSSAAAVVLPFANAVTQKQWMSGIARFIDALSDPRTQGDSWWRNLVAGLTVPAIAGAFERTIDPEIRRAGDTLDAIRARIPGLSDSLPPRLNLWGEPVKDENGLWNLFLPARFSSAKGDAIDEEIARLELELRPPGQVQSFGRGGVSLNIKLSPEMHNRLIELSGSELKDPATGRGAKDALNAMLETPAYQAATDEARDLMIRRVMQQYRAAAKAQLLEETPELQALIGEALTERATEITRPRSGSATSVRIQ